MFVSSQSVTNLTLGFMCNCLRSATHQLHFHLVYQRMQHDKPKHEYVGVVIARCATSFEVNVSLTVAPLFLRVLH